MALSRLRKAPPGAHLEVAYEAGPCGFAIARRLQQLHILCLVAAPSLIPKQPGALFKTDQRDARTLACPLRTGELTAVYVPKPTDEAIRDLCRARTDAGDDPLSHARFLLHDRDAKFSDAFDAILRDAGVEAIQLPPQSPNLNAFAERWVRAVKEECLDQSILSGERLLRRALNEHLTHHQHKRNHQGLVNLIPFPDDRVDCQVGTITKAERLGGFPNYYPRVAA